VEINRKWGKFHHMPHNVTYIVQRFSPASAARKPDRKNTFTQNNYTSVKPKHLRIVIQNISGTVCGLKYPENQKIEKR
jgi:hypothetical protein